MTKTIPSLPDLEISGLTKKLSDQSTIDRALHIIYEQRPDLFAKMAAREGTDVGPYDDFSKEFNSFVRDVVKKEINIEDHRVSTQIFWEARRRARLMYGMPI